ncbi:LOW QUALITY PROTEIN: hypothetical protein V2J09_007247 [Rumex salicifolius]
MAQAMMLTSGFCGHATPMKKQPSFYSQIRKIKRDYSPLPPRFSSTFTTFALFKSKTKAAPAKKVVEKPKRRVEDGIFGTSGGIGFTKQNELFVGRVAMIGFAMRNANNLEEESRDSIGALLIAQKLVATVLAFSLLLCSAANGQEDGGRSGGGALFNRACIGCHVGGGNVIQPGATLFADDLVRNGVATEEEIYEITYSGEGRMPGFGEKCTPRGQCTFGPRLLDEEIRLLAQFLNIETDIPIYEPEPLLLFFILFTLLGAIGALGDRGQFVDDPPTGLEKAVIPPLDSKKEVTFTSPINEIEPLMLFNVCRLLLLSTLEMASSSPTTMKRIRVQVALL